jgi:hypothetical protein
MNQISKPIPVPSSTFRPPVVTLANRRLPRA